MPSQHNLYNHLVAITTDYLGPAAPRFVDRQIHNHLNKHPAQLTRNDLSKLLDWFRITLALLTDDGDLVQEYIQRLQTLID